jgi:hypothetical protein
LNAERPLLAGLCLVCAFLSRPDVLFAAPLFLAELLHKYHSPAPPGSDDPRATTAGWRTWLKQYLGRLNRPAIVRDLLRFAAPVVVLGIVAAIFNVVRYGRPTEFGHTYLNVIQQEQIRKFGLFNFTYLGRNLACAFALTPSIVAGPPWIRVSWHGLAMWVTTPVLFYLLWPHKRGRLHTALWITVACVAIPSLLYQNSGWVQFGYRFGLDYMVFLVMLLAIGARPLTLQFKALCIYAFAINLFGAITFYWASQYYFNSYFPPGIN